MIIVTGATGNLGRRTVERLLERLTADRVGVSVRDPRKAQDLAARGVRVRQGSFDDPASLAHAFEGADQLLLVSLDRTGEECVTGHRAAIDAAVKAGVGRILYTSQMGAAHDSRFPACRDHAQTEDLLRATGLPWTALRNGFYAASALQFLESARRTGDIALPADGPVAWTGHDDLAEAAAAILTDEGRFEGPTPPLTGPAALDFDAVAGIAAQATGRPFTRTVVPGDAFHEQVLAHGAPAPIADLMLSIFAAARNGEFTAVDPTLAELIGREPATFRTLLEHTWAE
ncbi:SDR family oxidoreductase [Streptomyces sp. RPA4-5]|uniref:SDR family oxidoreductase n=1 Tax=unclassified Streptomyces TaxID=2593676 RepID=UPI00143EEB2E|nr:MULTISPECIES: SDR family oxidoreductase [unclassified Streptomyces]QIY58337.1 SDR family oxidoreductase [Streptomyces sp. RPA4-5]WJY41547.1 SDR family oxidoreductase [Streptomyces sp. P9-2B-2]